LLVRLHEDQKKLIAAQESSSPTSDIKQIQRGINRIWSELTRRVSVALAVFTFTLMGAAFAVTISRRRSPMGLCIVLGLATLYLIAFFAAKGTDHLLTTSMLLYLGPHVLIIGLSIWALKRTVRGVE